MVTHNLDFPIRNYLFIQNLYEQRSKVFRETWTISIEEWFYFTFPIFFYIISTLLNVNKKKSFLYILIIYIVVCNLLKMHYYFNVYPTHDFRQWIDFRELVVLRIDTIAIGLLGAYVCYFYEDFWERNKYRFLPYGLVIYFGSIFFYWSWVNFLQDNEFATFYHFTFYYLVSPVSIVLCLPYLKTIKFKNNFVNHFVLYTSLISYSLFLFHLSLVMLILFAIYLGVIKQITSTYMLYAFTGFIYLLWLFLTFYLSNLFFNKIELPIMNKRRWIIEKLKLND